MISIADIRKKNPAELKKLAGEKREALRAFRFGVSGSKIKNVKEAQNTRKEIARILTEITNRRTTVGE